MIKICRFIRLKNAMNFIKQILNDVNKCEVYYAHL